MSRLGGPSGPGPHKPTGLAESNVLDTHADAYHRKARRWRGPQGSSFFGYFIFRLICFPIALIVAYVVQDRTVLA